MASEEQYLDDLLNSMMGNEPRSMEKAMQDMNIAEDKASDFSSEDLNNMLNELEHTEPDRPAETEPSVESNQDPEPEEVIDAGEEEVVGEPVDEPITEPEEPVIDVEPEELESASDHDEDQAENNGTAQSDEAGWKAMDSTAQAEPEQKEDQKEDWKTDLDELLMSMKDQEEESGQQEQPVQETPDRTDAQEAGAVSTKENTEEDVTGILDRMDDKDEDLSDINEMLKKVDNNESLGTSDEDMLALLEGIKEAPSDTVEANGEQPDDENAKNVKTKKKKDKKTKKEKKPRKKLFGKKKSGNEEATESEENAGADEQNTAEGSDGAEAVPEDEAEVSLEDALENLREKTDDEDGNKDKKPGFFARLWQFLTEEAEEIEDEVDKGAENATGENAEILKELDEEKTKKKKKEKKEKKKKNKKDENPAGAEGEDGENAEAAPAKKKKKKEKKEKKEKEPRSKEPRLLTKRATIALIAFCATLVAAITFLSNFLPDYADRTDARKAYYAGDYRTVYEELHNKNLGSSDEIMYQRAEKILSLQNKLDAYQRRMELGQDMEALDALFQGVALYGELAADSTDIIEELNGIYQQICEILQNTYGVSAEEAMEINGYDNETYTRKLDSLLHGTEFYLPGEEPVEETPAVPEDVLPEEEAFIDMGDQV